MVINNKKLSNGVAEENKLVPCRDTVTIQTENNPVADKTAPVNNPPASPIKGGPEPAQSPTQTKPVQLATPKRSEGGTAAKPTVPFITKFKNKLTELRKQANQKRSEKVQKNLDKIMEYALKTQRIVNDDVERLIGVGDAQATIYLKKLLKQGKIIKFGKTSNTFYKPVK